MWYPIQKSTFDLLFSTANYEVNRGGQMNGGGLYTELTAFSRVCPDLRIESTFEDGDSYFYLKD